MLHKFMTISLIWQLYMESAFLLHLFLIAPIAPTIPVNIALLLSVCFTHRSHYSCQYISSPLRLLHPSLPLFMSIYLFSSPSASPIAPTIPVNISLLLSVCFSHRSHYSCQYISSPLRLLHPSLPLFLSIYLFSSPSPSPIAPTIPVNISLLLSVCFTHRSHYSCQYISSPLRLLLPPRYSSQLINVILLIM